MLESMPAHFYHLFSFLEAWVLSARYIHTKVLVIHQLDKHLLTHLPPEYWIELGRVSHVDYATPKFLLYSICKIGTNFRFFLWKSYWVFHGKATETKSISQSILMMNHLHGLKDVFKPMPFGLNTMNVHSNNVFWPQQPLMFMV